MSITIQSRKLENNSGEYQIKKGQWISFTHATEKVSKYIQGPFKVKDISYNAIHIENLSFWTIYFDPNMEKFIGRIGIVLLEPEYTLPSNYQVIIHDNEQSIKLQKILTVVSHLMEVDSLRDFPLGILPIVAQYV